MAVHVLAPAQRNRIALMFQDWVTMSWRNLIGYIRIPEQVFFSSVQPIMFILLFRYVFGGAIPIRGRSPYVNYLMPGDLRADGRLRRRSARRPGSRTISARA